MPVDYKNGKVYCIRSHQTDKVYVGSTTVSLSRRFNKHKSKFKTGIQFCTSKHILQYPDAYIELIEKCPCDSKDELHAREAHHIRSMSCVNKIIPGRTHKQWAVDNAVKLKQYRSDNAESTAIYSKQWRKDNKDKLKIDKKDYYDNTYRTTQLAREADRYQTDDAFRARKKAYSSARFNDQRTSILAKRREATKIKIQCECGSSISKDAMKRHLLSKTHLNYIND